MRRFRVIFLFMLFITLPLQGYAHFVTPQVPCPMEQMDTMDQVAGEMTGNCCNDADTAKKTGKACKTAQPCSSVGQALPFYDPGILSESAQSSVRFPRLADVMFTFDPAATWRPPAQL